MYFGIDSERHKHPEINLHQNEPKWPHHCQSSQLKKISGGAKQKDVTPGILVNV